MLAHYTNASSLYFIYKGSQAAPCFPMFVSIYMHLVCLSEWACVREFMFPCAEYVEYFCRHVGAFPCLRRNSDTDTLCWTVFPSSTPLFLPTTEGLREGAREGGRCRKVGGRERGRSTNTHQSLNKHLKTTAENLPRRFMSFCICFCTTWALKYWLCLLTLSVSLRELTTMYAE